MTCDVEKSINNKEKLFMSRILFVFLSFAVSFAQAQVALPNDVTLNLSDIYSHSTKPVQAGDFGDHKIIFTGKSSQGHECFVGQHTPQEDNSWFVVYERESSTQPYQVSSYFKGYTYLFGGTGLEIHVPGNNSTKGCHGDIDQDPTTGATTYSCSTYLAMNDFRACDFLDSVTAHVNLQFNLGSDFDVTKNNKPKFIKMNTTLDLACEDTTYKHKVPNGDCFQQK